MEVESFLKIIRKRCSGSRIEIIVSRITGNVTIHPSKEGAEDYRVLVTSPKSLEEESQQQQQEQEEDEEEQVLSPDPAI
ncbi:hypothetical protein RF55_12842 [Lasius niger]|uniref:Uncharacterized protein n=1 Tax=Lasius niger TaxID=67767 RepID=A0A0J7N525_LASNI|nr:hypothetical protein RF55_12842 [Lasius niger]